MDPFRVIPPSFAAALALALCPGPAAAQETETAPADPAPAEEPAQPDPAEPKPAENPGDSSEPADDPDSSEPADEDPDPLPAREIDTGYEEIEILTRVIETIRQSYVDKEKVRYDRLVSSALEGMLSSLDPHCQYMHRTVFEQMKREQSNTYDGVGITIAPKEDTLTIVSVREDGPAARAGVLPGDEIIKIGDALADEIGLAEAVQLLQGEPGDTLSLTLRRPSTRELKEVDMVREVIKQETVKDAMLLDASMTGDRKIGYVRLLQFNEPSADELAEALNTLEERGMEALVFDLRNNPGGLLNSAIEILGEFLPPDTVVLTTEGRVASQNPPPYRTPKRSPRPRNYPMAVLVNHGSASAAEVVSGALQDLNRAVIVGETTFGKGSVQSVIPTERGAAMRITTAKYYTPSHRTIHENGITPNIIATLTPDEERALMEWWRSNALNTPKARDLAKLGDRQLERAVDVLKGLLVYSKR